MWVEREPTEQDPGAREVEIPNSLARSLTNPPKPPGSGFRPGSPRVVGRNFPH